MRDLVFQTLLAEAQFRLAEKTITGMSLEEAVHEVSTEMCLDEDEARELSVRSKKPQTPRPVVEDELESELEVEAEDQPANSIAFHDEEDLEAAMGVLMYKSIPWISREEKSVSFKDAHDLGRAREALGRRWDFIDASSRTVAVLEFDNLEDYQKVLDFIGGKRMTVVVNQDSGELDEDHDVEQARQDKLHRETAKAAREAGEDLPDKPQSSMSFTALRKDRDVKAGDMDALADRNARNLRVSKRWK